MRIRIEGHVGEVEEAAEKVLEAVPGITIIGRYMRRHGNELYIYLRKDGPKSRTGPPPTPFPPSFAFDLEQHKARRVTVEELARKYGVSGATYHNMVKRWKKERGEE